MDSAVPPVLAFAYALSEHPDAENADTDVSVDIAFGPPSETVPESAGRSDIDHVLICDHGQVGARQILPGSAAETVVRRAPVSVTIV